MDDPTDTPESRWIRYLVELIGRHGGQATPRTLMRANSQRFPDVESAQVAFEALVASGKARWASIGRGNRRTRGVRLLEPALGTDYEPAIQLPSSEDPDECIVYPLPTEAWGRDYAADEGTAIATPDAAPEPMPSHDTDSDCPLPTSVPPPAPAEPVKTDASPRNARTGSPNNSAYAGPYVALGMTVLWYTQSNVTAEPMAALVVRVGSYNVCLSIYHWNCRDHILRDGVFHISDPRSRQPDAVESGAWDYTQEWEEFAELEARLAALKNALQIKKAAGTRA